MDKEIYYPLSVGEILDVIVGKMYVFVVVKLGVLIYDKNEKEWIKFFAFSDLALVVKEKILAEFQPLGYLHYLGLTDPCLEDPKLREKFKRYAQRISAHDLSIDEVDKGDVDRWMEMQAMKDFVHLAVSTNEQMIACCFSQIVIVIDISDGAIVFQRSHVLIEEIVDRCCFSSSGKLAIAYKNEIEIHDLANEAETVSVFQTGERETFELLFSPNGEKIAVLKQADSFGDGEIRCMVFDLQGNVIFQRQLRIAGFDKDNKIFYLENVDRLNLYSTEGAQDDFFFPFDSTGIAFSLSLYTERHNIEYEYKDRLHTLSVEIKQRC